MSTDKELSDKELWVWLPGTIVRLGISGLDGIEARISKASLDENGVTYLVVWWSGNERREAWVQPGEILRGYGGQDKIGFHA